MERRENGKYNLEGKVQDLQDAGQNIAANVKDRAQGIASRACDGGNAALHRLGDTISGAGATLESSLASDGRVGSVVKSAANRLKSTGGVLSNYQVENAVGDAREIIRKYPVYAIAAGVGFGLLLRGLFSRRS